MADPEDDLVNAMYSLWLTPSAVHRLFEPLGSWSLRSESCLADTGPCLQRRCTG